MPAPTARKPSAPPPSGRKRRTGDAPGGQRGHSADPPAVLDPLAEGFLEYLSVEKNVSHRTLANYAHAITTFRAAIGSPASGCACPDVS